MAIPKLQGSVDNIGTLRVMACLFEHQIQFEFVAVDVNAAQNMTLSFLSLSPFGELPVFQDGDLTLFESRAAMRYISHEYASQAIEHVYLTPLIQGCATTWIDVETHHFQPVAMKLIFELVEKPRDGLNTNEEVVVDEGKKLARVLDVYEERLSNSPFLGGDKFTSADLTHSPYIHMLMTTHLKIAFQTRIHVGKWCDKLLSRAAWVKVVDMIAKNNRASLI